MVKKGQDNSVSGSEVGEPGEHEPTRSTGVHKESLEANVENGRSGDGGRRKEEQGHVLSVPFSVASLAVEGALPFAR